MTRKLTPNQRKFADNFIKSGNLYQSAVDAGYSKAYARSSASKLRENAGIKAYIEKRMKEIESAKIMDAKEAMELLSRIARGEETETVFVPLIDGSVSEEEKEADLKTRISAIKEIIKRYPNDDQLLKARLRNETAKARIAEYQADQLEGKGEVNPLLIGIQDAISHNNDEGDGDNSDMAEES